jgi:hypothetical protein
MTTLVTGASGTVGRSLAGQLAEAGEPVRALTRDPAATRFPPRRPGLRGRPRRPRVAGGRAGRGRAAAPVPGPRDRAGGGRPGRAGRGAAGHRAVVRFGDRRLRHRPPAPGRAGGGGVRAGVDPPAPGRVRGQPAGPVGPSIRAERVVRWPFPDEAGIPIHEADIAAVAVVGEDVRLEQVSREEALRQLREQGGWAASTARSCWATRASRPARSTPRSPWRSWRRCQRSSGSRAGPPAPSPAGPWTTPATSAEVSRPGAPGGCGPRSGRRGRGSGRTRSGCRSGRG